MYSCFLRYGIDNSFNTCAGGVSARFGVRKSVSVCMVNENRVRLVFKIDYTRL